MRRLLALAAAASLVVAACTGAGAPERASPVPSREPWRGGTLRMLSGLWPVRRIDPGYFGYAGLHWELYRCCLLRTLFSYAAVPATEGGTFARPDLAIADPRVSDDGLTWTVHLREGVRYAPPFDDTPIVSGDVVRALERLGCPAVRFVGNEAFGALFRRSLRTIGIRVEVVTPASFDEVVALVADPAQQVGAIDLMLWAADYPNASSWFVQLFHGSSIIAGKNNNLSLLGASDEQLARWGYQTTDVPSADDRIDRCLVMTDRAQTECWAELDLWLMENVVPAIPLDELASTWVTSPRVDGYSFDAATGNPALDRISLHPGAE